MKTITINLYKFQELKKEAKQTALVSLSDINIDFDWWFCTYEDALNIGLEVTGFENNVWLRGKFTDTETAAAEKIIKEHGKDCQTYKTAKSFLDSWAKLVAKYSDGQEKDRVTEANEQEFDEKADILEALFLKDLCSDYLKILGIDYEYQISDEGIIETINANNYDFTEDGKQY